MSTESLGSAVLHLSVDTSNFEAAIQRSKNVAAGLGTAAEAAFQKSDSQAKRAATSLIRFAETFGKTAEEARLLNAAMRGVPLDVLTAAAGKLATTKEEMAAAARAADLLAIKTQHAADGLAFEEAAAGAQRVRRMQEAVSVFTAELDRMEAVERDQSAKNAFISSLQQQAVAIGKTKTELLELKAAELGVSQQAAPFIAKLREQEGALMHTSARFNEYGLSAKQTTAALRQVPAQITDIFVSLQGGQNPLTVLIQQGGQLRDVFGGIKPAAEALGGALLRLINPWTLLAAAIVGVGYAITETQSRQGALTNSLVASGNAAATTTERLEAMAKVLDETTQASERHASAVVAQVSATGRFTEQQIEQVSKAALQLEQQGRSVQQTIQDFASIGDDPVQAILRLNSALGDGTQITNFLTAETVKSIEQLAQQGDTAEASRILFEAYASAINTRSPEITANLSAMARAWINIKENAGDAADAAINAVNHIGDAVRESMKDVFSVRFPGLFDAASKPAAAPSVGVVKPISPADLKAYHDFQTELKANLSDEEKQRNEITRITNEGNRSLKAGLVTQEQINKAIADSNARYKEQQDRKNHKGNRGAIALEGAEAKAALQEIKNGLQEEQTAISNSNSVLQAKYQARLITSEQYWSETKRLTEEGMRSEEAALEAEIAVLQKRDVHGKISVDNLRQIGELEAQLAKVRADGATKLVVLGVQEDAFYKQREESIESYKDSLIEANLALQQQVNESIAAIGVGQQHAARQSAINRVYDEQAEKIRNLAEALKFGRIDQVQYDADLAAAKNFTEERVRILQEGYAAMDAMEADWRNGLRAGLEDWVANASKMASQIRDITGRELDLATDALTNFAETGKLEIKSLLASMLKELVSFFAKRAVMMFVQYFLGSFGSSPSAGFTPSASQSGNGLFNAKGNPFVGGTTLPSNSILTQPTAFRFAKGAAFGVAGEAGAEAVMPLTRGPDGKLGVQAHGAMGGGISLQVNTTVNSDGSASSNVTSKGQQDRAAQEFTQKMRDVSLSTIQKEMQPGGTLWRAGVGVTR